MLDDDVTTLKASVV